MLFYLLHITTQSAWDVARAAGEYRAESLESEGFIHCSRPDQVIQVANTLFRGQSGLVLLSIERAKVNCEIRQENLEGGQELFPHIYGPLNLDAVVEVVEFSPGEDGYFSLPDALKKRFSPSP